MNSIALRSISLNLTIEVKMGHSSKHVPNEGTEVIREVSVFALQTAVT